MSDQNVGSFFTGCRVFSPAEALQDPLHFDRVEIIERKQFDLVVEHHDWNSRLTTYSIDELYNLDAFQCIKVSSEKNQFIRQVRCP